MAAAQGINAFAFDIYHELVARDGNLLFSPVSIHLGMALAFAGARGETADQMAAALFYSAPPWEIAVSLEPLQESLNEPHLVPFGQQPAYELSIANALWVAADCPLEADFTDPLRERMGARLELVDFSKSGTARGMINAWAAQETRNRIQGIVGPGLLSSLTRLVLTNAVYFKNGWSSRFSPAETRHTSLCA